MKYYKIAFLKNKVLLLMKKIRKLQGAYYETRGGASINIKQPQNKAYYIDLKVAQNSALGMAMVGFSTA